MIRWRKPPARKWKLILVSHTHWDREWYLPFQEFRARLIEAVDSLLDLMANSPDYRYFTLDGQTVVLEDYLEVRPEREAELRDLIAQGRVVIGPWYVMPDEFLVSGEALVRNLLEGRRTAARFGPVMEVGYVPDPFGHIAQLPQIFQGFGIDSAVLWRGVGALLRKDQALWEAPDGSQVLLLYMSGGYDNAAVVPSGGDPLMERLSQIQAELGPRATTDYLLLMNGDDHMMPQRDIPAIVAEANRRLKDSDLIHGTLPMLLDGIRATTGDRSDGWQRLGGELRSSELAHLLAGVLSARVNIKQRNAHCETLLERWAEPFSCFASLLSSGDPETAYSGTDRGRRDSFPLLRVAWRYLLKNQPHDSICGCSVDQVHREMETRYDWCQQIAEVTTARSLDLLAQAVDTETNWEARTSPGAVVVFNSETGPRTDFATATASLPADRASALLVDPGGREVPWQILQEHMAEVAAASLHRSEVQGYLRLSGPGKDWPHWKLRMLEKVIRAALRGRMPDLGIISMDVVPGPDPTTVNVEAEVASGREHDYDALSQGMKQLTNLVERGDAQFFRLRARRRDQVDIGFVAPEVPGHGLQTLRFVSGASIPTLPHSHGLTTLENEYLSLQVSPEDGTVRLIDRESGAIFWGLNSFADGGDAGDEYTYSPPPEDWQVTSPSAPPEITLEEAGPARQMLRVEMDYSLPASLADDRRTRSQETVPCRITTWLSLYPGVPRIDIRTTIANEARDHRLRVLFPTHLDATNSRADGQFAVVERPVDGTTSSEGWLERPVGTHPQMAFVDLSDGKSGLMIANRGLREYEVIRQDRGPTITLTLLRCVGWLSRDDLATRQGAAGPIVPTPGAQMPGTHQFEYAIIPHVGGWEGAVAQAYAFARPLAARWTGNHAGVLAPRISFLSVSPTSMVVSAVKRADDGSGDLVVRLYNLLSEPADVTVGLFVPVGSAALANLAEERLEEIPIQPDGSLRFQTGPNKIVTLRLTPVGRGSE